MLWLSGFLIGVATGAIGIILIACISINNDKKGDDR